MKNPDACGLLSAPEATINTRPSSNARRRARTGDNQKVVRPKLGVSELVKIATTSTYMIPDPPISPSGTRETVPPSSPSLRRACWRTAFGGHRSTSPARPQRCLGWLEQVCGRPSGWRRARTRPLMRRARSVPERPYWRGRRQSFESREPPCTERFASRHGHPRLANSHTIRRSQ
jgi:hypothetical protein